MNKTTIIVSVRPNNKYLLSFHVLCAFECNWLTKCNLSDKQTPSASLFFSWFRSSVIKKETTSFTSEQWVSLSVSHIDQAIVHQYISRIKRTVCEMKSSKDIKSATWGFICSLILLLCVWKQQKRVITIKPNRLHRIHLCEIEWEREQKMFRNDVISMEIRVILHIPTAYCPYISSSNCENQLLLRSYYRPLYQSVVWWRDSDVINISRLLKLCVEKWAYENVFIGWVCCNDNKNHYRLWNSSGCVLSAHCASIHIINGYAELYSIHIIALYSWKRIFGSERVRVNAL